MISKIKLTKKILKSNQYALTNKNFKKFYKLWWMNSRLEESNGLRLTEQGVNWFKDVAQFTSYTISLPSKIVYSSELILSLDKFMDSPYYLDKNSIVVFREKTAVELILYSGDLRKYSWAKQQSHKNND